VAALIPGRHRRDGDRGGDEYEGQARGWMVMVMGDEP